MRIKMPGLAQRRIDHISNHNDSSNKNYNNASSVPSSNEFWSRHRDDVSYNQLQKFWSELSPQSRQELLRIDRQTLFEQARKNMYCSRCNGLLLEGFLQIVMYGKSLQQGGAGTCNISNALKGQKDVDCLGNGSQDEVQDPSVHPWGGLTTTRDGSLTLLDCYLYSKSLIGLQNVFDGARKREREREFLYPDACGGVGRGWISQGITSYGRGHATRETCALHTARISCGTLVDFWSALGEEPRQSLLRLKEEDFIERLMYRFDSKRFCRDCRKNVIREFKELKELKRLRKEPRCTSWFCVADTAFLYEVSYDTVQADWQQTFADNAGSYHHFEWAVGTGEGKSDIVEFENVGMSGSVRVNGLDLCGLSACFITLRAWTFDGYCTELSVKAHALNGQKCVHSRLIVGDGYVSITREEDIRMFFEHAEEAEEEEDDDSMDKDGNDMDGECFRPRKHAKSPELAREFLLDSATVVFKEQVEKAFREGTARQNAHSIFVCLALKLLEERIHVACKEIITLEKQMKLLEEEEREKREEEERKERKRAKEREKKQRRKERLKGKERDKGTSGSESNPISAVPGATKEELLQNLEDEACGGAANEVVDISPSRSASPNSDNEQTGKVCAALGKQSDCYDGQDGETTSATDGSGSVTVEQSKFTRRKLKYCKDVQIDSIFKWSDMRRYSVKSDIGSMASKSELKYHGDNWETPSRAINGLGHQVRINGAKPRTRNFSPKCSDKFRSSSDRSSDRYDNHSCRCSQNNEYRHRVQPHISLSQLVQKDKSESAVDMSKQFKCDDKYNNKEYDYENYGGPKSKALNGNNACRDLRHAKKVWEPLELHKQLRSNPDSGVAMRESSIKVEGMESDNNFVPSPSDASLSQASGSSDDISGKDNSNGSRHPSIRKDTDPKNGGHFEEKNTCNLNESSESVMVHKMKKSTLISASATSSSNLDNCSSCHSEGDSNTASSSNVNKESSSMSDSEGVSQLSEGQESSRCKQNNLSVYPNDEMDKKQNGSEEVPLVNRTSLNFPQNGMAVPGDPLAKTAGHLETGTSTVGLGSHPQCVIPQVHNPNVPFPMFQAPAMGYYRHPPVSWQMAPASGFLQFPYPDHYVCAGLVAYSLHDNSSFCMQYGPTHHIASPLFNAAPLPVCQPVPRANRMNSKESPTYKPDVALHQASTEKVDLAGQCPLKAPLPREYVGKDSSAKQHDESASFSLFHFGGPVALSTRSKSDSFLSKDEIMDKFSSKISKHHIEVDSESNNNETTVGEYTLFAASNGMKFPPF